MSIIDEMISKNLMEIKQLERRKMMRDRQEKIAREKLAQRRIFLVGTYFLNAFPEFLSLQPKKSDEENQIEFAPLLRFLQTLSHSHNHLDSVEECKCDVSENQ